MLPEAPVLDRDRRLQAATATSAPAVSSCLFFFAGIVPSNDLSLAVMNEFVPMLIGLSELQVALRADDRRRDRRGDDRGGRDGEDHDGEGHESTRQARASRGSMAPVATAPAGDRREVIRGTLTRRHDLPIAGFPAG